MRSIVNRSRNQSFHFLSIEFWMNRSFGFALGLTASLWCANARAEGKSVSFSHDVLPVFQASCAGCHQPGKLKGGLDLTTYEGVVKGGKKGESFKAGDPEHSFIIEQVSGDMPEMPN